MEPLPELAKDPFESFSWQTQTRIFQTIDYFKGKINKHQKILDVGQKSPLTSALEAYFKVNIDNTKGDLDTAFYIPNCEYDVIIYSHTIEHQFNPLHTLLILKEVMHSDSIMYIFIPCRPRFLSTEGHFHELSNYSMKLLMKRARLEVISIHKHKVWRPWRNYIGIRAFLRLFLEWNLVYKTKKQ